MPVVKRITSLTKAEVCQRMNDGSPVWIKTLGKCDLERKSGSGWGIISKLSGIVMQEFSSRSLWMYRYGIDWIAYDNKPETVS